MFKNRIRTAAIAGIAALATGVSGTVVATPAFAQTTLEAPGAPAGDYWDDRDASAAFNAEPVNHSEEDIKAASDVTQEFIVEGAPDAWRDLQSNLNWDPSEEARAGDIREMLDLVTAEQARNAATINQIQESIAYAFQQDQEATAAWQAVVERAYEINSELREEDKAPVANDQTDPETGATYGETLYIPQGGAGEASRKPLSEFSPAEFWTIGELINFYADRDGHVGILPETLAVLQTDLGENPSDVAVRDFYRALQGFDADGTFQELYDEAGEFLADGDSAAQEGFEYQRFSRYAVAAIVELYGEVEDYIADLDELLDASADASREAQQSDVLVRQGFLMRAVAQRDLLRNWEGYLLAYARYIELYNDPTLTVDRTLLSTEYREVLDDLEYGLTVNTPRLVTLDEAVTSAFDEWSNDLNTNADVSDIRDGINDEWDFQIVEERLDAAAAELAKIREQGAIWREALNRVQALEIELGQPSDTDRIVDAINDLLNGSDDDDNNGGGSIDDGNIGGGSSFDAPEFGGGSSALGGFGIAAVIAAIIGVLALVVPNIQNFL